MANYSQKWKFSISDCFFALDETVSAVPDNLLKEKHAWIQGYPDILFYSTSRNKPQAFHLTGVLHTGGNEIDTRGLNAGMA